MPERICIPPVVCRHGPHMSALQTSFRQGADTSHVTGMDNIVYHLPEIWLELFRLLYYILHTGPEARGFQASPQADDAVAAHQEQQRCEDRHGAHDSRHMNGALFANSMLEAKPLPSGWRESQYGNSVNSALPPRIPSCVWRILATLITIALSPRAL